jgi:hypothetical protein
VLVGGRRRGEGAQGRDRQVGVLGEGRGDAGQLLEVGGDPPRSAPALGDLQGGVEERLDDRRALLAPQQDDVLLPYADRFLDEIPALAGGGMLAVFGLMFGMFPQVADQAFVGRAQEMTEDPSCDPTVRAALLIGIDTLARRERSRAA